MQNSSTKHKVKGTRRLTLKHTETKGDVATVYVVGNESSTYILSADDCAPSVLGWTETSVSDSMPDAMKWWISQYSEGIAQAVSEGRTINRVSAPQPAIEPLLFTTWRQEAPFNNLCNDVAEGSLTGCVATAMAQIMKHYNYPEHGTGVNTYTSNGVSISSNFSEHAYQWDKMLNSYNYWGNGDEAEAAVALLMRDCGVALEMNYSAQASSAANSMVAYALMTYFGYDKAMENLYRSDFTDDEWEDKIVSELAAGHPVFYSGASSGSGGHAFVCDGYDGNGYFHFNWGWGGGCDGFFLITGAGALNPYRNSLESDCYTIGQMITVGIQPDCGGKKKSGYLEFFEPYKLISNYTTFYRSYYFQISDSYLINRSMAPMHAVLGVRLECGDEVVDIKGYNAEATYNLKSSYMPYYWIYLSEVPRNGVYKVYPIFMDLEEENPKWQLVKYPEGQEVPTIEIVGSEINLTIAEEPYVYCNGLRNLNNKATEDDLTVHLKVNVINDISDCTIYCTLYDNASKSNVAYGEVVCSAKAGDVLNIDLKPEKYYYMDKIEPGTYSVIFKAQYKSLIPSSLNNLPITILTKMPTISDVPITIYKVHKNEATKQNIEDTVNDILNTIPVKE